MQFTISQLAALLGGTVEGNADLTVHQLGKIDEENTPGSICFLANPKYEPYLYTTTATAVIVNQDFEAKKAFTTTLIRVADAYNAFTKLLEEYEKILQQAYQQRKQGVEAPAHVSTTAQLGSQVYVGAFAYIADNVVLNDEVKVYPQVYIGEGVRVGKGTIIYAGAKIYPNTEIGANCVIHAGAVIGSEGFGFAPQADGTYKNIPQLGKVILEDNVSIGANTTIDRATLGATIIRQGAKLDNLIQIGHNVEVGKNTAMAAQVGISGSTKIGERVMIGGQAGIAGHLHIADEVKIGAQSGINSSIKEKGQTVIGAPAFEFKAFMKSWVVFRRLPDLQKQIDQLAQKTLNLPKSE